MKTKKDIVSEGYEVTFTNGTGSGGQKRNRTLSVAVVKHLETGIVQRSDETRIANKNMNLAYQLIKLAIQGQKLTAYENQLNDHRKAVLQKGTIRTYDFKRGVCKNHLTGNEAPLKKVLNGHIELINK